MRGRELIWPAARVNQRISDRPCNDHGLQPGRSIPSIRCSSVPPRSDACCAATSPTWASAPTMTRCRRTTGRRWRRFRVTWEIRVRAPWQSACTVYWMHSRTSAIRGYLRDSRDPVDATIPPVTDASMSTTNSNWDPCDSSPNHGPTSCPCLTNHAFECIGLSRHKGTSGTAMERDSVPSRCPAKVKGIHSRRVRSRYRRQVASRRNTCANHQVGRSTSHKSANRTKRHCNGSATARRADGRGTEDLGKLAFRCGRGH